MDFFVGQPDIGRSWNLLLVWKKVCPLALFADFAPILSSVVLIGEAALGGGLDLLVLANKNGGRCREAPTAQFVPLGNQPADFPAREKEQEPRRTSIRHRLTVRASVGLSAGPLLASGASSETISAGTAISCRRHRPRPPPSKPSTAV